MSKQVHFGDKKKKKKVENLIKFTEFESVTVSSHST